MSGGVCIGGAPSAAGFTASGDEVAEARVARDASALVALLRATLPDIRAVFLVGGYGRGEGGVYAGPSGPEPFNDYDILAVVEGGGPLRLRRAKHRLSAVRERLHATAGVPVDVALQERRALRRVPLSILWYEMAAGHRLVWGDAAAGEFPRFDPRDLPLDEAILLLTNRGSSLLLRAAGRGRPGPPQSVSVHDATDAMKLVLAWGDTLLLRARQYTVSYRDRLSRLEELDDAGPFGDEVKRWYRRAVEFKLSPDPQAVSPEDVEGVARLHGRFLEWFESTRHGPVRSWAQYASPGVHKLRRVLPSARMLAKHSLRLGVPRDLTNLRFHVAPTYERLVSVLPLLLLSEDPSDWKSAAHLLNSPERGGQHWESTARRYLALWK